MGTLQEISSSSSVAAILLLLPMNTSLTSKPRFSVTIGPDSYLRSAKHKDCFLQALVKSF